MTPEQFVYWLKEFFELSETKTLTEKQVTVIKGHIALTMDEKTPVESDQKNMDTSPCASTVDIDRGIKTVMTCSAGGTNTFYQF